MLADAHLVSSSPPLRWGSRPKVLVGTSPFVREFSALCQAACPEGTFRTSCLRYVCEFLVSLFVGFGYCWFILVVWSFSEDIDLGGYLIVLLKWFLLSDLIVFQVFIRFGSLYVSAGPLAGPLAGLLAGQLDYQLTSWLGGLRVR